MSLPPIREAQLRPLTKEMPAGVSNLSVSLGLTGRRVVLGHTLNIQTLTKTDEQKKVLSKFTILCWAPFIAILGHTWPVGRGLDAPARVSREVAEAWDFLWREEGHPRDLSSQTAPQNY